MWKLLVESVKFGEPCKMGIPSQALKREGVETRRQTRKGRYSPDHKPERGNESCSGKHNRSVLSSSLRGPISSCGAGSSGSSYKAASPKFDSWQEE